MLVYIYAAEFYCEDCGEAIRKRVTSEGYTPVDPDNEFSYISDIYPKGPYPDGGGKSDCPQHCGAGPECLNAIELMDGSKVGVWLENELTIDGVEYVREAIREGGEMAEMWADFYCNYNLKMGTQQL